MVIRKLPNSNRYRLYNKSVPRRNLGTFMNRADAVRHEREVQFFKKQHTNFRY